MMRIRRCKDIQVVYEKNGRQRCSLPAVCMVWVCRGCLLVCVRFVQACMGVLDQMVCAGYMDLFSLVR